MCDLEGCSPESALRRLFWRSLHRRASAFAGLLLLLRPRFFLLDRELAEEAGNATSIGELLLAINGYRQDCAARHGFLHDDLRIRISGKRMISLFRHTKQLAHRRRGGEVSS